MTTCLLDSQARLLLYGGRLTIQQPGRANCHLPLAQVERIVIRNPTDPALQALLTLAEAGRPVHFINAHGDPIATLKPHTPSAKPQPIGEHLVAALFRNTDTAIYQHWLENQRNHVCSRLIRHSRAEDWPRIEAALLRYLRRAIGHTPCLHATLREFRGLLWAWLDARFQRLGLYDLAEALEGRGYAFQSDLEALLSLPLHAWLAPMLREHPNTVFDPGARFQILEPRLEERLWLHLNALSANLNHNISTRRRRRKPFSAAGMGTSAPQKIPHGR